MLTPKSVLVPCQIKDLTNNYELITTTNKLGHGVSYSTLQEIMTEVAYSKAENVNENEEILPENCSPGIFSILVEDNIDKLEETTSGNTLVHCPLLFHLGLLFIKYMFGGLEIDVFFLFFCFPGLGTTHKVNSIIIQPKSAEQENDSEFSYLSSGRIVPPPSKSKRRYVSYLIKSLLSFNH